MRKSVFVLLFTASAMMPLAAFGDGSAAPVTTGDTTISDRTTDLDQVICKKIGPPTGSRIGGKTVCQTKKQWLLLETESQDTLSKAQNSSNMPAGGGK